MANLAEPALEALRQAQLGSEHQGQLRKLLQSPSARIREFAMQALAAQGTARTHPGTHRLPGQPRPQPARGRAERAFQRARRRRAAVRAAA